MNAIDVLCSRNSNPLLSEPAPEGAALEQIFQVVLRTPDHANLKPWRFVLFAGDARYELGKLMCDAALKENPELEQVKQDKLLNAPLRAPLVVAGIVKLTEHPKVPEIEQWLSIGGALTNLLNAAHALGFAGMWRSGDIMFNPHLHESLALNNNEKLAGFIYLGSAKKGEKRLQPLDTADFVSNWESA